MADSLRRVLPVEVSSPATTRRGDLLSILRAYQVICSEMDLSKLIAGVTRIVIQNTNTQNGMFLVPDASGRLFIEAYGEGGSQEVHRAHCDVGNAQPPLTSPFSPLVNSGRVPPTLSIGVVQHVYSTKTSVVLSDACHDGIFTDEPHVQRSKTKSVLCVPVINSSKVVAILYLENNMMTDAFTAEQLEVVQLLSSQIGVSLENASLYKDLQSAHALLETRNKALMEMDHIKDQFLANTSHDLRAPLNGIIGLAESLIDGATGTLSQATCNSLAMIVNSGRRLANLVNDILDVSALKAGGIKLRPHPTDLKKTLDDVIYLSSHLIGLKDVELLDETGDLPTMRLDESRIQQVLQNIIGNAIKFTHRGKVIIRSEVTDDWVQLTFSDTGCGIAASEFETIFEDFKQADGGSDRELGGTGLGLSIAKKLIGLHEGHIEVSSVVDKGSTFTIKLPAKLIIKESPQMISL